MVRKLGSKRAGTGKIETQTLTENTDKWTSAVAKQLENNEKVKDIIVKTLPISSVRLSKDNPRKLAVNRKQIESIAANIDLKKQIAQTNDHDWIEELTQQIIEQFGLTGKQIGDFVSLVEFAASLKSAERLLHPIVVWKEESTFNLISGERRLLAHLLLNESHISSQLLASKPQQKDIDILQWQENVHREDMTLSECLDRLEKLINAVETVKSTSVRKLAKLAGLSKTDAQRYLVILRYPDAMLRKAIDSGKIQSLTKAAALAQLSANELQKKLDNVRQQPDLAKPTIKLSRDVNKQTLAKIVTVLSREFKGAAEIDKLNLDKTKDLEVALNLLVKHIEAIG